MHVPKWCGNSMSTPIAINDILQTVSKHEAVIRIWYFPYVELARCAQWEKQNKNILFQTSKRYSCYTDFIFTVSITIWTLICLGDNKIYVNFYVTLFVFYVTLRHSWIKVYHRQYGSVILNILISIAIYTNQALLLSNQISLIRRSRIK